MASDFRLKEQLPDLTERIVETYTEVGTINHLGHCPLPSYDVIIGVIEDLKEILYPGYRRREGLHLGNVSYHVGTLVDRLARPADHADRPRAAARRRRAQCRGETDVDFEALGQAKTIQFLEQLPELRRLLAARRASGLRRRPGREDTRRGDLLLSRAWTRSPSIAWRTCCTSWKSR